MYKKFFKRFLDLILSVTALAVLSPFLLIFTVLGAVMMKGNPFFVQERPGMINKKTGKERIIPYIKFRTMSNKRDKSGELLPDEQRLGAYGRFLRSASIDELPSLVNVIIGQVSLVGPRPLLVKYLPLYSKEQRRRHEVLPGITGYAQAYGRNSLSWEEKFEKDVYYVDHISFALDIRILIKTVSVVFKHENISSATNATMEEFTGTENVQKANH